jgi:glycosyltransferase involved in cell wall biosynthesis
MKILILTPQLPYPPQQGTSLRNYHIIRGLAEGHQLTLLSFLEDGQTADPQTITPLHQLCQKIETISVPKRNTATRLRQLVSSCLPDMAHRLFSPVFELALRRLLLENRFDVVQVEGIELARYIGLIRDVQPSAKIVFDDHNAETELQRRNFLTDVQNPRRWLAAAYSWVQVGRLRRIERWAIEQADATVAVSEIDRQHLQKLNRKQYSVISNQSLITVIPNCLDVASYQRVTDEEVSFDLLFSGKMDYRPNVDAVLWFADEVWPLICEKRPSTTWAVVGQKPHARLQRIQGIPGITMTGWVESVRPYLAGASVYIMPFRIGSGTRLKLIEAMAAGKAIVSTTVGAEGFPAQSGEQLLLADSAQAMATAVLQLLDNPQKREQFGRMASQLAQQYDWRQVIPRFQEVYMQIVR